MQMVKLTNSGNTAVSISLIGDGAFDIVAGTTEIVPMSVIHYRITNNAVSHINGVALSATFKASSYNVATNQEIPLQHT